MAGTLTASSSGLSRGITRYSFVWVSDASGDVSGTDVTLKSGTLLQMTTIPAAAGAAPTDNYDLVINDAQGVDILGGAGANRDTANAEVVVPAVSTYFRRYVEAGTFTPVVSNAGNAKGGTIVLLIQ